MHCPACGFHPLPNVVSKNEAHLCSQSSICRLQAVPLLIGISRLKT